ncbi:MAG: hypothetical protein P4M11_13280 [Candidatus Pacebacteria bacterium]|nr:hypothetical protein [Candidatus Paceibacterota bacterium]
MILVILSSLVVIMGEDKFPIVAIATVALNNYVGVRLSLSI